MKCFADADDLAAAIAWVSSVIPNNPTVPVIAGVLITATDDGLVKLIGTDLETFLRAEVPSAVVDEPGTVLVPGKALAAVTSGMRDTVTLTEDGARLNIAAGRAKYTLATLPVDEYPSWAQHEPKRLTEVDADTWRTILTAVSSAVATDNTLPVLTGVRVVAEEDELILRSTDRYNLASAVAAAKVSPFDALVPGRTLQAVSKGLSGPVTMGRDGGLFGIGDDRHEALIRTIDGQHPDLSLPFERAEHEWGFTVNRAELLAALKRLGAVSSGKNAAVIITLADGEIELATHEDETVSGREYLAATIDPGTIDTVPQDVSFAPGRLANAVTVHTTDHVTIGNSKGRVDWPFMVTGDPAITTIVMPLRKPTAQ